MAFGSEKAWPPPLLLSPGSQSVGRSGNVSLPPSQEEAETGLAGYVVTGEMGVSCMHGTPYSTNLGGMPHTSPSSLPPPSHLSEITQKLFGLPIDFGGRRKEGRKTFSPLS